MTRSRRFLLLEEQTGRQAGSARTLQTIVLLGF